MSYNKYLQPAENGKPEINLKQSPLALLAQTCSAIESNLYSKIKPSFSSYSNLSQSNQKVTENYFAKTSAAEINKSPKTSNKTAKALNKNLKTEKTHSKKLKRASSQNLCYGATQSPKKQKLTPMSAKSVSPLPVDSAFVINSNAFVSQSRTSPVSMSSLLPESNFNHQANIQMQMMNPMHYYMKTIEDQLKSSQHVCNWMVNNVTCGKKFSTSDQLLSHLQTHAMTSQQPSYPPISSLQTNQMLQSAYSLLQSQQNQLASMQLAAQNNLGGFPMYKPTSMFNQGNIANLSASLPFYYNPFNHVLS